MTPRTASEAARDLLACQHALTRMDQAARQMRTIYAGHVPAEEATEFVAYYVQWLMHRWFAEQWLRLQPAANDQTHGVRYRPRRTHFPGAAQPAPGLSMPAVARHLPAADTPRPRDPSQWLPAGGIET